MSRPPRQDRPRRCRGIARAIAVLGLAGAASAQAGPAFDIWYGDTQDFGTLGVPQTWINVLGNVADPDGIGSLSFTLNGGAPQALSIGPDTRRLLEPGDFNVEIAFTDLLAGANTVVLSATDGLGNPSQKTVTVNWSSGNVWPLPYDADWSTATSVTERSQVVDGKWQLAPGGLRTTVMGYDRTVCVGDLAWTDYEVTVPITVHAIDPGGFVFPSVSPGVGFTARWQGHTELVPGEQPHAFWLPAGGGPWYDYADDEFGLSGGDGLSIDDPTGAQIAFDTTYNWKLRTETLPNGDTFYGFKVWLDGQPEPAGYFLHGTEPPVDLDNGSLILIAHHVDATFGDVDARPLAGETTPPAILAPSVVASDTSATFTWTTNEPATTRVEWGLTPAFELGVLEQTALVVDHSIAIGGLPSATQIHWRLTSTDGRGNTGAYTGVPFTTGSGPPASGFVSDDFSAPAASAGLWTFVDPLGDSSLAVDGGTARISPGAAQTHDYWVGADALPRIVQAMADQDFEVEVKFESVPDEDFESHGILVEEGVGEALRVEVHHNGSETRVFVACFDLFQPTIHTNQLIAAPGAPLWLRLRRTGSDWEFWRSSDGSSWTLASTFAHAMSVQSVGVYAGNSAGHAHTATIDYVFNTAAPIVPEDGGLFPVAVGVQGQGSVSTSPDLGAYGAGQPITVTATPAAGWVFHAWTGDLAGQPNPAQLVVQGPVTADAVFIPVSNGVPPVLSTVETLAGPVGARFTWATDVPATSRVEYGLTPGYELGFVEDATLELLHAVEIAGLAPGSTIHYRVVSEDLELDSASTADATFVTPLPGSDPAGIVSDDFDDTDLDTGTWTFVDPVGDAHLVLTGRSARIEVPRGQTHDLWSSGIDVPYLHQSVADVDLACEVGWRSTPSAPFQSQGLLVEGLEGFLRLELHYFAGNVQLFAASITGSSGDIAHYQPLPPPGPPYSTPSWMRVLRIGDAWVVLASFDGITWVATAPFVVPLTVTGIGLYAGNSDGQSSEADIDYFWGLAEPLIPQDADPTALSIDVLGLGQVTRSPAKAKYDEGEGVTLTAVPNAGWAFDGWSGAASGSTNPLALTLSALDQVTATFVQSDTQAPSVSGIGAAATATTATITWTTDEPASSLVEYGPTSAYGDSASDAASSTSHAVALTGLVPDTVYHYRVTSADPAGNATTSQDFTFLTQASGQVLVSDDFSAASLDASVWTFVDPLQDSSYAVNGTQLEIRVPATGQVHDVWTDGNTLPRLRQAVADTNFEFDVRFESQVTQDFQSQGILIEQTDGDVLRIELDHANGEENLFVASIFGGQGDIEAFLTPAQGPPERFRVRRIGDEFRVEFSYTGAEWTELAEFVQPMTVTGISVFAGNSQFVPHTALVDFVFDTAQPIVPEDADPSALVVNVVGGGSVTRSPNLPSYDPGDVVQLTAIPDFGWSFAGWTGPVVGTGSSVQVTVGASTEVVATFTPGGSPPSIASITPSVIETLQVGVDETVTITGANFTASSSVLVDGVPVPSSTWIDATRIDFAWPLVFALGPVDVSVVDANGTATAPVTVTLNASPQLQMGDGDEPVDFFAATGVDLVLASQPSDVMVLYVSGSSLPSVAPGLLTLEIGAQFSSLLLVGVLALPAEGWVPVAIPYSYSGAPVTLYWQAVAVDALHAAPLRPTNAQTTVIHD